jgi:hypothetical protein
MNAREILDSIKAGLTGITPGEWKAWDRGIGYEVHGEYDEPINIGHRETFTKADASFIAAAPVTVARLTAALEAVLSMADAWEADYGPGSRAEQVLGKQKVSIDFAVGQIRTAIEKALTD